MKVLKAVFSVGVAIAIGLAAVGGPAQAGGRHGGGHHHHGAVGVWGPGWWGGWGWRGAWGPGWWGPGWGWGGWGPGWGPGWGATWPSTVVVVPQEPRVFVERGEAAAPAPASQDAPQWWYWCPSANAYYPYVSTCSEGWQRVSPQPMSPSR